MNSCATEQALNKNVGCLISWLAKQLKYGTLARTKMSKVAREWRGLNFANIFSTFFIKRGELENFMRPQSGTLTTCGCNVPAHQIALELEYLKQDASPVG